MNPRCETYLAHGEPASGQAVLTWNGGAIRGKRKVGLWGSVIASCVGCTRPQSEGTTGGHGLRGREERQRVVCGRCIGPSAMFTWGSTGWARPVPREKCLEKFLKSLTMTVPEEHLA